MSSFDWPIQGYGYLCYGTVHPIFKKTLFSFFLFVFIFFSFSLSSAQDFSSSLLDHGHLGDDQPTVQLGQICPYGLTRRRPRDGRLFVICLVLARKGTGNGQAMKSEHGMRELEEARSHTWAAHASTNAQQHARDEHGLALKTRV